MSDLRDLDPPWHESWCATARNQPCNCGADPVDAVIRETTKRIKEAFDRPPQSRARTPMTKFRKKPVVITAAQWFKNGDHPDDATARMQPEIEDCEGAVVRYYRHPRVPGDSLCEQCGKPHHDHSPFSPPFSAP